MKIEFNKVTWYSKLAAVILGVAIFFLGIYLGFQFGEVKAFVATIDSSSHRGHHRHGMHGNYTTSTNATSTASTTPPVSISNQATVVIGQTIKISDVSITFNKLIQDNRCPVDVQCIVAGKVTVGVTLESGDKKETRNFSSDESPYRFAGHSISIVKVEPIKHSKQEVTEKDYSITFKAE